MKKISIAIDGHSACGKSTLAKQLAKELSYQYIDTGAMYRGVTLFALQHNLIKEGEVEKEQLQKHLQELTITFTLEKGKNKTVLNGKVVEDDIRSMEVSSHVSAIAAIKEVRQKLVALQQELGEKGGVVMDGRDIGTVVMPHAELKVFMTASDQVRAQRRYSELQGKGKDVSFEEVLQNLKHRDQIDSTREESPLIQDNDARVLDNSDLSKEEQLQLVLKWVKEAVK